MKIQKGFTLVELMIVLVIIGIMAGIAVPSYQNSMERAARHEAMVALLDMMRAQEDYFANNYTYTTTLSNLNYVGTVKVGGDRYTVTASTCTTGGLTSCIKLTADSTDSPGTVAGDLTLDSRGTRELSGVIGWPQ